MRARVLGAAAGGGFPQWNCGCANCRGVRAGTVKAIPRTQDSLAVGSDGEGWFLLNASPEIRGQIESFPALHPRESRHSPIRALLLTNGDLDHCLGLLSLRESHPLVVYSTERVRQGLVESNTMLRTLRRFPGQLTWRLLKPGLEEELSDLDGRPSGLSVRALPIPGKLPVHLEGLMPPDPEDNVGLWVREPKTGRLMVYLPGAASVEDQLVQALEGADCLFFDGTFWSDDELVRLGLGTKRAAEMAHLPIGGGAGSMARLAGLGCARKIYTHVNNTNPILLADSAERRAVEAAGWEVAGDGMEIRL